MIAGAVWPSARWFRRASALCACVYLALAAGCGRRGAAPGAAQQQPQAAAAQTAGGRRFDCAAFSLWCPQGWLLSWNAQALTLGVGPGDHHCTVIVGPAQSSVPVPRTLAAAEALARQSAARSQLVVASVRSAWVTLAGRRASVVRVDERVAFGSPVSQRLRFYSVPEGDSWIAVLVSTRGQQSLEPAVQHMLASLILSGTGHRAAQALPRSPRSSPAPDQKAG